MNSPHCLITDDNFKVYNDRRHQLLGKWWTHKVLSWKEQEEFDWLNDEIQVYIRNNTKLPSAEESLKALEELDKAIEELKSI